MLILVDDAGIGPPENSHCVGLVSIGSVRRLNSCSCTKKYNAIKTSACFHVQYYALKKKEQETFTKILGSSSQ